ncbi:MAG: biotin--[acetyl-CoA-carboxylase] ligase [Eubacteriales bacterium]
MKTEILQLLRASDSYVSGQEICQRLEVSRTAIWKVINQLKEEGYVIEAVSKKGYRLQECPDLVTKSEIHSQLDTKWLGREMTCVSEVGSTNQELKKLAEEGACHGSTYVANVQMAGRGRRGREWDSKTGNHITMSLLLRPTFEPSIASMLTLVMAVSVAKAIEEVTKLSCMIKWPNDILIEGRKVAGILTEMSAEQGYIHYVVIGVGVNVNEEELPPQIAEIATSIQQQRGVEQNRSRLIVRILHYFEQEYERFCQQGDLGHIMEWYEKHLRNIGSVVRVESPSGVYEAKAVGMNEQGELLVEREGGRIEAIYAGEVSIRGINGYV